jgi:hypothetical protein
MANQTSKPPQPVKALSELDAQIAELKKSLDPVATATTVSYVPAWWSTTNAMTMSSAVLIFGLIVMFYAQRLIRAEKSGDAILRIFGTMMIIISGLFLIVAGYADQQIAPVMGLLGTIAGYLLGKDTKDTPKNAADLDRGDNHK